MKKSAKKKKAVPQNGEKLPNKIACSSCKQSKGVRPDVLLKRIKDYGTLENLLETYECQKCRKRPESQAPTAKRSRAKPGADYVHPDTGELVYFWQVPGWTMTQARNPYRPTESSYEYQLAYGTTCARPAIYLDNNRFCDGCPFYNTCTCTSKRLRADGGVITTADGETKKMSYYMRRKLGLLKWTKKG